MPLRAKKPEAIQKRFKMFMFGPAGVGKSTAAIQFPNSYIIDAERGTDNYGALIDGSGSVVFQTSDIQEVIAEVKSLLTERHDYRTLVIDPITTIYNDLIDKCEMQVGSDFGRHFGAANKTMKRLANLILALDMNVIVTAHAKAEYGQNLAKIGYTFDGWKQLDYWFDLVVELGKKGKKRFAKVVKTRVEAFPDEEVFEWNYEAVKSRYDVGLLEKQASQLKLATAKQVKEIKELLSVVRLPEGTVDKWFAKSGAELWEDMPGDTIAKCIAYIQGRKGGNGQAPRQEDPPAPQQPKAPDALQEFKADLHTVFKRRGFTPAGEKAAVASALINYGVDSLDKLTEDQRVAVLAQVADGKADHLAKNLPSPEQVREIKDLLGLVRLPKGTVEKWFTKAGVNLWEDMPADVVQKCIEYVKGRLPAMTAA